MNLLIDAGNSHFKWTVAEGQDDITTVSSHPNCETSSSALDSIWGNISAPDQILVSNVGNEDLAALLENWCGRQWRLEPKFVQVRREYQGVTCGYEDISQLGVDRWLAIVAGWHRYRQACFIVDCGTATTIDVVNSKGKHQGGLILPGLRLMQDILSKGTHRIGSIMGQERLCFANNTGDAVANGCLMAVTASIERALQSFRSLEGDAVHYLLTGGGSRSIQPHLQFEFEYIEALVLKGLQIMANDL